MTSQGDSRDHNNQSHRGISTAAVFLAASAMLSSRKSTLATKRRERKKAKRQARKSSATTQTRVSKGQASSRVATIDSNKQSPTAQFKAWIDNAIHREGDDSDQLDEDTLIEIVTRSADFYRRIKQDRSRPTDDGEGPPSKVLKTLTVAAIKEPNFIPSQKIGIKPREGSRPADSNSEDEDSDSSDSDTDSDEDEGQIVSAGRDNHGIAESEDSSEDEGDENVSSAEGSGASEDDNHDAQKSTLRTLDGRSHQVAQLSRHRAMPLWELKNGHERSLLISLHPLRGDSKTTAPAARTLHKLTTSDIIKAMRKPGCILEGDGDDGRPASLLEIYKEKHQFLNMWASPEEVKRVMNTNTPLDGLGYLTLDKEDRIAKRPSRRELSALWAQIRAHPEYDSQDDELMYPVKQTRLDRSTVRSQQSFDLDLVACGRPPAPALEALCVCICACKG
jgi:hypothetical protein